MTPDQIVPWLSHPLAPLLMLVLALYGVVVEWWIPGRSHRRQLEDAKSEAANWRAVALDGTGLLERTVGVIRKRADAAHDN